MNLWVWFWLPWWFLLANLHPHRCPTCPRNDRTIWRDNNWACWACDLQGAE